MKKDNNPPDIGDNPDFKNSWTLDNAMHVLQHPTVDAETWSEAVEWLMLYGPEEIKKHLLEASEFATKKQFPTIKTAGCNSDGDICYNIEDVAEALDIDVEEARRIIAEKERSHNKRHGFTDSETTKVQ